MLDTTNHTRPTDNPVDHTGPDDPWTPARRVTVFWWATFDRPIMLTALGTAGSMLAIWAIPLPVQLIGLLVALSSLTAAGRLWVREFRTPASERGCAVIEGGPRGRHSC